MIKKNTPSLNDLTRIGRTGMAFLMTFMIASWSTTTASAEDISVRYSFYEDWGTGACAEAWVTNHGSSRVDWEADLDLGYPVNHHWNSERLRVLKGEPHQARVHHWTAIIRNSNGASLHHLSH